MQNTVLCMSVCIYERQHNWKLPNSFCLSHYYLIIRHSNVSEHTIKKSSIINKVRRFNKQIFNCVFIYYQRKSKYLNSNWFNLEHQSLEKRDWNKGWIVQNYEYVYDNRNRRICLSPKKLLNVFRGKSCRIRKGIFFSNRPASIIWKAAEKENVKALLEESSQADSNWPVCPIDCGVCRLATYRLAG